MRRFAETSCSLRRPDRRRRRDALVGAIAGTLCWVMSIGLGAAHAQSPSAPEPSTGRAEKPAVVARQYMAVTANDLASQAAAQILRRGGSAVDAAIAAQFVLNLVEPQSSGIGGGAFMLVWHAADKELIAFDGREIAPRAATPDMLLDADGKPVPFDRLVRTGRAVGIPGVVRLLAETHKRYGKLSWASLFEPALALADNGFPMSPRLHRLLTLYPALKDDAGARALYFDAAGDVKPVGARIVNPAFAAALRAIAANGADAFYTGNIAAEFAGAPGRTAIMPARIAPDELAQYRIEVRQPVCAPYRMYRVCTMGPPSAAGVAIPQILSLLSGHELARLKPDSAEVAHLVAEASRLAHADKNLYVADPAFVPVPLKGLLDDAYLRSRASAIRPDRTMGTAPPGEPPRRDGLRRGRDTTDESDGTTHLSIADGFGNVVAMTSTIENAFGAQITVRGFFLNNEMTDFAWLPARDNKLSVNRVEPGKRPRSSMSPTIVFDAEVRPVLAVGSPGGERILSYVTRTLLLVLDWNMDAQRAVAQPHLLNRNGATELEKDTAIVALKPQLEALGHQVVVRDLNSGLHAIQWRNGMLIGGADPRREGTARGE
ncbi:MAG: gamma-glutamyltransferase [Alphaproteobacteria bacterium]